MARGDERRWRSSIADRVEDETHRTTEPTGEKREAPGRSESRAAYPTERLPPIVKITTTLLAIPPLFVLLIGVWGDST